jgi:cytochrome c oxidase subunit 2
MRGLPIFPVEASTRAVATDHIFFALLAMSAATILLVLSLVVVFSIRYRRGSSAPRGQLPKIVSKEFEIGWTVATFFAFLFIFWWVSSSQLTGLKPPPDALEIHVVAKQWMWKIQHPSGVREINALHAPSGVPVRLVMTSQDVIHSFYVPEFRMKQDVLPGRYTETWFKATRPGVYRLECAEYCGLDHSRMLGEVVILSPADYGRWTTAQPQPQDLAGQGGALYRKLGCAACHDPASPTRNAPLLGGLFGQRVQLADGRVVQVDETFLHDALTLPEKTVPAGYTALMPSYAKATDEEGLTALIAYLKALPAPPATTAASSGGRS